MLLEDVGQITVNQLIEWIQEEKERVGQKLLALQRKNEPDLIVKASLDSYKENLDFFEQDILRLAKGMAFEQAAEVN